MTVEPLRKFLRRERGESDMTPSLAKAKWLPSLEDYDRGRENTRGEGVEP